MVSVFILPVLLAMGKMLRPFSTPLFLELNRIYSIIFYSHSLDNPAFVKSDKDLEKG